MEIDLGVLGANLRALQSVLSDSTETMFVVKADAYGHGLVPVAQKAAETGVNWFAVAYIDEALQLRAHVPNANILVLGAVDPTDIKNLIEYRITPVIVSESHGVELAESAHALGEQLAVHLKIDTGMGRLGVLWGEAPDVLERLCNTPGLDVKGLCSHFATVEPDDPVSAVTQFKRFSSVVGSSDRQFFTHISSSRAFLYHKEWDLSAVRVGVAAYGYGTAERETRSVTKPILQWKATVMQVKDLPEGSPIGYYGTYITPAPTRVATLAVGYADGYLRTLSNRGHVLIRGKRCRVVGRVSMNWITVDLGTGSDVEPGDEAVLIGRQGDREVWAGELASLCRTIPYEILTSIHARSERRYFQT